MASCDLHHLAVRLADDGPSAHHEALRTVAERALCAGAPPVLAHVVASASEPPIARLRAFGVLVGVLDSPSGRQPAPRGAVA